MIAAEELARLRVPLASLPGFDPVGLYAWWAYGTGDERRVVVSGPYGDRSLRLCLVEHDEAGMNRSSGRQWFRLDLADASTADRVARWVAGRVGLEVGCTAPSWTTKLGPDRWILRTPAGARLFVRAIPERVDRGDAAHHWHAVPGLPLTSFSRLLSDGSRYTDRLALALVSIHVGGVR